jgi:hypothetical protein
VNETEQEKRRSLEIFHSWDWPELQVFQKRAEKLIAERPLERSYCDFGH